MRRKDSRQDSAVATGDIVKFRNPYPDEAGERYTVVDDFGDDSDRCLVRLVCRLPLKPTSIQLKKDLAKI